MELIPGLPNELALEVLLRLPTPFYPQAMEVSSLWRIALCSDRFYMLRRLRTPFSSLFFLLKSPHTQKDANSQVYEILELDSTNPSSVAPRLLASSQAGPLSRIAFPNLGFDCCASLSNTSFLLLNTSDMDGWMQFNILSRQWLPFGTQAALPFHLQVDHVYLLGLLDSRIFLLVSTLETSLRKVAVSYDYTTHCWDMHPGLPEPFSLDRMRLTFQGQIFIRNNGDFPLVYAFDPSTKSWIAHEQMTERLLVVPSWSRVIACSEGTLMCVIQSNPGILMVMQQDVGQTKWRSQLEIATGGCIRVEFYLFIQDEHILLVTEGARDNMQETRCQEYLVGQRRLTCIFVPYYVLMSAVLLGS